MNEIFMFLGKISPHTHLGPHRVRNFETTKAPKFRKKLSLHAIDGQQVTSINIQNLFSKFNEFLTYYKSKHNFQLIFKQNQGINFKLDKITSYIHVKFSEINVLNRFDIPLPLPPHTRTHTMGITLN